MRLTVSDLDRSSAFYEQVIGLRATDLGDGRVALGNGTATLVELEGARSARRPDLGAPGLYHLALLVPTRAALAVALTRLLNAQWPLDGASDHLVSEALYLSDPDGNGIELYSDRPREQWRMSEGRLEMATLPLDLRSLLETRGSDLLQPAPGATTIGHVHLQVSDLGEAEAFYHGMLGFDVTVRSYPGALFVSAGGYHHHLGLNTWHSKGAQAPPPGSLGLRSFEIVVPDEQELSRVLDRIRTSGVVTESGAESGAEGVSLRDPSGNGIVVRSPRAISRR